MKGDDHMVDMFGSLGGFESVHIADFAHPITIKN